MCCTDVDHEMMAASSTEDVDGGIGTVGTKKAAARSSGWKVVNC